jgi:hypothetical protein
MLVAALVAAVTLAGVAAGYALAGNDVTERVVTVRVGDNVDFEPHNWRCNNYRRYIDCFTGDAKPFARLAIRHRCGCVALKVYNLRGARRPTRTIERGRVVYTFIAF